jgi:hypothetical protein
VANTRPEFRILDGRARIAETDANAKRNNVSAFSTVEQLNKHPSLFINYLRVLASAKGMTFVIKTLPEEHEAEGAAHD